MYIWLKFARLITSYNKRGPLDMFSGVSQLEYRVGPWDVDFNLHMNNGRYLTLLDLGRVDFGLRAGLDKPIKQKPWIPLVASLTTSFRRELRLWQRYRIDTRLYAWDEEWVYFEQRFVITSGKNEGRLSASAIIMACLYDKDRKARVPMRDVFAVLGKEWREAPDLPGHIRAMAGVSKAISSETRTSGIEG